MADELTDWIETTFQLAASTFNQGGVGRSQALARQILAARPDHPGALQLMGLCALAAGGAGEAAVWLAESLKYLPNNSLALMQLAMAQKALGDSELAASTLEKAAGLDPANAQIRINLANLLQDGGDFEQGLVHYRKAAELEPSNALVRYNLGMTLLTLGRFEEGWIEAEWRWKAAGLDLERVDFKAPLWQGETKPGLTLLLWAEQGFGDSIMFCRFVPILARLGLRVLLQAPKPLLPLFESLEGLSGLFAEGDPLPAYDAHAPLLAVPGKLRIGTSTIPSQTPYLGAKPASVQKWRERLAAFAGPRIGLCWRGNPHHANDANRSLSPGLLGPLLVAPEISWIAIQPDPGPNPPAIYNAGPDLADWGDTAGLLANLDLVISIDSSVAHLAGAMNRPCRLLLPYLPDWRWLLERSDSPWYPSLELFRQEKPGDWDGVMRRVDETLKRLPR